MTQHHEGLKPASDLAILRWQRLMAQALTGLNGQVRPSTRAEAPGLLAYGEPAFALIACIRRLEGHDPAPRVPDVTTMVPVTADSSIHDVRDTGGLWRGLPGQGHLDAAILRAPLGGGVRGDGLRLAQPPRRDHVRLHALRDQILHHRFGTLLRQHLVRGDALPLAAPARLGRCRYSRSPRASTAETAPIAGPAWR